MAMATAAMRTAAPNLTDPLPLMHMATGTAGMRTADAVARARR